MRNWILLISFTLSFSAHSNETCAPLQASPETEQGKVLYAKYKEKGLHLHSFPTWSGEDFYALGNSTHYQFSISEVYWGQACRVTRKLYIYDLSNNILGYYGNLSVVPKLTDLKRLKIKQPLFLDGEHYDWHSI